MPLLIIAENVAHKTGLFEHLEENQKTFLTYVSHYACGAVAGAAFASMHKRTPQTVPNILQGLVFGVSVCTGSYGGFLAAAGLYRQANQEPAERKALMLGAHFVWGAALGLGYSLLARQFATRTSTRHTNKRQDAVVN